MDPDPGSTTQLIAALGVALCLIVLAVTSAADAAMTAIGRHRLNLLQSEDATRAARISRLLADPYRFKAAIILLNVVATIVATALALLLVRPFAPAAQIGALALLLLLILVFCEALPKALALRNPHGTAQALSAPVALVTRLVWPAIALVDLITRPLIRLFSGSPAPDTPLVTAEELRLLVNVGEEEGLIEPDERQMIEGIFSFGDTLVREVMVPRVDIVALEADASVDEALNVIIGAGHSRIPVYEETIDRIAGVLYAKDVLPLLRTGEHQTPISAMLRDPYFVPDSMKVDALLRELQTRKVHLAIVVDEYGGTAGLVTIEDLLEEIVGEIQDEYDAEEPSIELVSDGVLIADARVLLDDINDLTGLGLHSEESDRIGGLVYEQLGQVPQVGDRVQLPDDVTITVLSVERLGPRRLQIAYRPAERAAGDTAGEEVLHDNPT